MKMKIICTYILIIAAVLSLLGCGSSGDDSKFKLFYLSKEENQLYSRGYDSETTDRDKLVDELLAKLKDASGDRDIITPGFDTAKLLGWSISDENNLTLNFNSDYTTIPTIKEILCRAAIVKTLCQIDGIDTVEFNIEGDPLTDINGQQTGFMSEETFVDNTSGETTYKQTINATVYFADDSGKHLVKIPINMTFDGTISMEQLLVEQLIKGPADIKGVTTVLKAVIPENTVINHITVKEKVCYIDMSKDFLAAVEGVKRELTIYSIVNSLAELSDINKVQFTIDGETVRYFGDSNIPFDVPFERNLEIVKE